ncbi:uncharacterized protein C8Q71DRAFT_908353 [Rhodofomes roseus]|uniref:Uncharacterized protein n=1 Tax=Rhodofomes roseus TaxID=34475 RepID=A0ABQ8KC22_9APHY|nr:uncharacterized protein C8Q71DRAFT_908353 [Rhodofomes roseus]KAH9835156.1 hypothetical protein C8Q71DRAFT_908353 [Rhodofomes roseus]
MPPPANWTFAASIKNTDTILVDSDEIENCCSQQIEYLRALKASWYGTHYDSEVLASWKSLKLSGTPSEDDGYPVATAFNVQIIGAQLSHVSTSETLVSDLENSGGSDVNVDHSTVHDGLCARLRRPVSVTRCSSSAYWAGWYPLKADEANVDLAMTLFQVAQVLQYQDSQFLAEHVIATAFDGIPGTYVRRKNLGILGLKHTEHAIEPVDCAVIHVPTGRSVESALEYLAHIPISAKSPAFVLCMKGPMQWESGSWQAGSTGSQRPDLQSIIHDLARLAEVSLSSMVQWWSTPSTDAQTIAFPPACAMTIGLVYDSENIHMVAHIPYHTDGNYKYLSLLFDKLPFPSRCTGSVHEFIQGRYRVALALLSLQQHICRLTELPQQRHLDSVQAPLIVPFPGTRVDDEQIQATDKSETEVEEPYGLGREQVENWRRQTTRTLEAGMEPELQEYMTGSDSDRPRSKDAAHQSSVMHFNDDSDSADPNFTPISPVEDVYRRFTVSLEREDQQLLSLMKWLASPSHSCDTSSDSLLSLTRIVCGHDTILPMAPLMAERWKHLSLPWGKVYESAKLLRSYARDATRGFFMTGFNKERTKAIPVGFYETQEYVTQSDGDTHAPQSQATTVTAAQLTSGLVKKTMQFCSQYMTSEDSSWLGSGSGRSDDYMESVPRVYVRDDATAEQRASILTLFHPCAPSLQLVQELASEHLIGDTILKLLAPYSGYFAFVPPVIGAHSAIDENCHLPLAVILPGDPSIKTKDIPGVRRRMAETLSRTLTTLVLHHYRNNDWMYDRKLTEEDAAIHLDKHFFVFSIFYKRDYFSIDINYPVVEPVIPKSKDYIWRFCSVEGMHRTLEDRVPLGPEDKHPIFQALLFVEQHIHLLRRKLTSSGMEL